MFNGFVNNKPDSKFKSNIKSIQTGSVFISTSDLTKDVTISSIDITKTIVMVSSIHDYNGTAATTDGKYILYSAKIINSTNLRIERGATASAATIYYQIIEFNNVKSLQTGTATLSGINSSLTVSINSIIQSKSFIVCSTRTTTTGSGNIWEYKIAETIASNFQLQFFHSNNSSGTPATMIIEWQVIEFI